jgi:deazaflavin-dependent oxidoreductase (nitroreductase family)
VAADDYCYLTTTGRATGQDHQIEIWYARDGDTLYLLSGEGDHADWVRNLSRSRSCTIRWERGGPPTPAHARVLTEPTDEARRARELLFTKYQDRTEDDLRRWRVEARPVALDLEA